MAEMLWGFALQPTELHGQWNLHEMNHKKFHEFVDSTGFNPYSEGFFIVGPISAPLASALQWFEVAIETRRIWSSTKFESTVA